MKNWHDFDLDRTIRDYDYTKRAVYNINRIINSSEFASKDADTIFQYISGEMEIVLFPDYLKRYIYEKTKPDSPFKEIPDSVYIDTIIRSFEENNTPFSFSESKTRKSLVIKRWLTQASVKRETVFLLGFGLNMSAEDVSEFLVKVLKEEDFDFEDPEEILLWFCFKNNLQYVQFRKLIRKYEEMEPGEYKEKMWNSMSESPELFLGTERNLHTYLLQVKTIRVQENKQEKAYEEFDRLYGKCCEIIAEMRNREAEFIDGGDLIGVSEITVRDVEKELCCGIPSRKSGNLEAMTRSCFASLFELKCMTRQRITQILARQRRVERFDLITLLFFIYAETVEPDWPAERFIQYIDEINRILHRCRMMDIYPVNPYEAFILMCIVTDFPMAVYSEVWEKSFDAEEL